MCESMQRQLNMRIEDVLGLGRRRLLRLYEILVVLGDRQVVLLSSTLARNKVSHRRRPYRGSLTHGLTSKFGHHCFHGLFVFFEKHAQLFVLMLKRLVVNDGLGILTLEF